MAKDFEITCPHCSKSFSGEDLLKDHIAEADKEFNKERQILIDEKKKAQVQAKKVEVEADKKRKENEQSISSLASANKILKERDAQSSKKMKEREKEILSQATKKADAEANKKMKEREKELQLEATKKAEAESNKKFKEKEQQIALEAKKKAEAESNKKMKEREAEILSQATKKAETEASKKFKDKEKEAKAAQMQLDKKNKEIEIIQSKAKKDIEEARKETNKKLQDLQKKMEQDASERKGENQEQIIEEFLGKNFPLDKIIPIKKGARGADCIQQINDRERTNISRIYYESKDTKEFSESWVDKLLGDMAEKDINFGIIVTQTMPKSNDGKIEFRHNNRIAICPMDWELLWAQANSYREMGVLFSKFEGKNTPDNLGKDELWDAFKTGSNYKLITKMNQQYLDEVKNLDSHEKSFNKLKINSQNRRKVFLEFIANLKNVSDLYPEDFLDED
jgi:chemotaxis protein histidine kinase CheA